MRIAAPLASSLLGSLLIASSASAVSMDWTPIGEPGNACDTKPQGCFGSVGYTYNIGTYEVTNAQYVEFLNAKAASDPLGLYNTNMGSSIYGGITQNCSPSCTYSVISGRGDMPVNFVSFYDSLRFTNWLNNGHGSASTETGAYTLLGGTATPSNGTTVTRNGGATIVLTSEDEWYKAAYHNAIGLAAIDYFDYPAGSDTQTACSTPTATPNSANCDQAVRNLTIRGSYTGSASPYGTFDQGGNVWEWNEAILRGSDGGLDRGVRGAAFFNTRIALAALTQGIFSPENEVDYVGFRIAMIPEPGTGLLVITGLLGLARWRKARA